MLDRIREFFGGHFGGGDVSAPMDERLATAALLVHTIAVDGSTSEAEDAAVRTALAAAFGLDPDAATALVREARERDAEAVDLYGFTSILKRSLDEAGRERVIEQMWELVYADGDVHEFEDNLIWRVAELLGVSARARIRLRQRTEARLSAGDLSQA